MLESFIKDFNIFEYEPHIPLKYRVQGKYAKLFYLPSNAQSDKVSVVIASVINSSQVFFLNQEFTKTLLDQGDVIVVEWEACSSLDSLSLYTEDLCEVILNLKQNYSSINLVGYCLGGLISIGAASILQDNIKRLILLSTPWDFDHFNLKHFDLESFSLIENFPSKIHSSQLQPLIFMVSPFENLQKFEKYETIKNKKIFLNTEKWIMSENLISKGVIREIFQGFGLENKALSNKWLISGEVVSLSNIKIPTFILAGQRDKIVPISSCNLLSLSIENSYTYIINTGHIGFLVGSKSAEFLNELKGWFKAGN